MNERVVTPEMLRKFAEAGKWHVQRIPHVDRNDHFYGLINPTGVLYGSSAFESKIWDYLPDFRLPSQLPACFDVLERFTVGYKLTWTIATIPSQCGECSRQGRHYNVVIDDFEPDDLPEACAETLNEAIIRAVLVTVESKERT